MLRKNAFTIAAVLVFALCGFSGTASAGQLGVDFQLSNPVEFGQSIWNLGYQFTVVSNITVVGLANVDFGSLSNFAQDQQVGLWDSDGNLLASAYVGVDQGSTQMGLWGVTAISGVLLKAGQTYIVGGQGGEEYSGQTPVAVSPAITWVTDLFTGVGTANNPLQEPTSTEGYTSPDQAGWFGGNIVIGTAPEPATLLLLVPALGALMVRRRRRA